MGAAAVTGATLGAVGGESISAGRVGELVLVMGARRCGGLAGRRGSCGAVFTKGGALGVTDGTTVGGETLGCGGGSSSIRTISGRSSECACRNTLLSTPNQNRVKATPSREAQHHTTSRTRWGVISRDSTMLTAQLFSAGTQKIVLAPPLISH